MKVAIYTLPFEANYGGVLQAYALQSVLSAKGFTPIVLNRRRDAGLIRNFLKFIKWTLIKGIALCGFRKGNVLAELERFKCRYLNQSRLMFSSSSLSRYCRDAKIVSVIVGSDQVWRVKAAQDIKDAFLAFAPEHVRKVSYAASFGVEEWEYPIRETEICAKLAKQFDAVSVREDSGIDLCREKLDVAAKLVLDPTLLFGREGFTKIYEPKIMKLKDKCSGGACAFLLDKSKDKECIVDYIATKIGCGKYSIGAGSVLTTVEEWLYGIANANFVITDSFHGTCFSLLFKKPFIAIYNKNRGNARFKSLLGLFSLEDRIVEAGEGTEILDKIISSQIDYAAVNERMEALRSESMEFLVKGLRA